MEDETAFAELNGKTITKAVLVDSSCLRLTLSDGKTINVVVGSETPNDDFNPILYIET